MMIGALKEFFLKIRTASRPSMSGRPTSIMTRSICPPFAACTPLAPVSTEMASNSSWSDNCSTSASRNSVSSSTIRILRAVAIKSLGNRSWLPRVKQVEQSTRKAQAQPAYTAGDDATFGLLKLYAPDNAGKFDLEDKARKSPTGLVVDRPPVHQSGAWSFRHQGQQAGRRRRDSGGVLSAGPIVVAPGPPPTTADAVAGQADHCSGRMVRRP